MGFLRRPLRGEPWKTADGPALRASAAHFQKLTCGYAATFIWLVEVCVLQRHYE
jgi:hypothetical protein